TLRTRSRFLVALSSSLFLSAAITAGQSSSGWPPATPADVGVDQSTLLVLDREIKEGKYGNVDGVLVIRCGKLIWERSYSRDYKALNGGRIWMQQPADGQYNYFNPDWHPFYRGSTLHTMQSVTKTLTALTYGVAIKRRDFKASLDTPVLKYFDE